MALKKVFLCCTYTVGVKKAAAEALAACMMNGFPCQLNSHSTCNMSHNSSPSYILLNAPNVFSYILPIKVVSEVVSILFLYNPSKSRVTLQGKLPQNTKKTKIKHLKCEDASKPDCRKIFKFVQIKSK